MRTGATISACIVCRNEADKLGPCLESVAWTDEILVLDLESTDESAEVARSHGARVISHAPVPVVEAVRNVLGDEAIGEWILALDPDERVTPGLRDRLLELRHRADIDAVAIPFMNYDLGYPARHPVHRYDPKPRFYRRGRVRWPEVPNTLPRIPADRVFALPARDDLVMIHERNRTIPEAIERALRYAPAEAQSMVERGEVFTARTMLRTLGGKAYKQFVVAKPWREGVPGFFRAGILLAHHFYVWAAFWQLSGAARTEADDRLMRRIGGTVEALRFPGRLAKRTVRLTGRAAELAEKRAGGPRQARRAPAPGQTTDDR
jgi:glycosyltransferase involved in cell wall biosynthesis